VEHDLALPVARGGEQRRTRLAARHERDRERRGQSEERIGGRAIVAELNSTSEFAWHRAGLSPRGVRELDPASRARAADEQRDHLGLMFQRCCRQHRSAGVLEQA
jgi:hypothetical protein